MLADALRSRTAVQTTTSKQEHAGTPVTDAHGGRQHVAPGPSGAQRRPGMCLLIGFYNFFCFFFWGCFLIFFLRVWFLFISLRFIGSDCTAPTSGSPGLDLIPYVPHLQDHCLYIEKRCTEVIQSAVRELNANLNGSYYLLESGIGVVELLDLPNRHPLSVQKVGLASLATSKDIVPQGKPSVWGISSCVVRHDSLVVTVVSFCFFFLQI